MTAQDRAGRDERRSDDNRSSQAADEVMSFESFAKRLSKLALAVAAHSFSLDYSVVKALISLASTAVRWHSSDFLFRFISSCERELSSQNERLVQRPVLGNATPLSTLFRESSEPHGELLLRVTMEQRTREKSSLNVTKAIVLEAAGGPERLRMQERPSPVPGPGEILIDIAAASVNFMDVATRIKMYPVGPLPMTPGVEGTGHIAAVGNGVTEFKVGDRVAWFFDPGGKFVDEVLRLSDGEGVHVVYDGAGADTFSGSLASLRPHGVLAYYGQAIKRLPPIDLLDLPKSVLVTYPGVFDHVRTREALLRRSRQLFHWIRSGKLRVYIGQRYALADALRAHEDVQSRRTTGKLLLIP